jgi:hypothetical protein
MFFKPVTRWGKCCHHCPRDEYREATIHQLQRKLERTDPAEALWLDYMENDRQLTQEDQRTLFRYLCRRVNELSEALEELTGLGETVSEPSAEGSSSSTDE